MTVYVDDMAVNYRNMIMFHMLADNDEELHAMADKIGVKRIHHQKAGTVHSHYDICKSKRAIAIQCGAVQIGRRQVAELLRKRRIQTISNAKHQ